MLVRKQFHVKSTRLSLYRCAFSLLYLDLPTPVAGCALVFSSNACFVYMIPKMLFTSTYFALIMSCITIANAVTIHETCKSMTGVDEYGYSPDVSDAVATAYKYMQMIAKNGDSVIERYRTKQLPSNERVRISSLLTAFGFPDGDKRQGLFLYQLSGKGPY